MHEKVKETSKKGYAFIHENGKNIIRKAKIKVYKKEDKLGNIVGIDLGTTCSAIAKLDDTGRPDIIDDIDGKNVTPSVVEFTSKTSFIVGDGAKAAIGISDENIVQEVKRSMGSSSTEYEFWSKTYSDIN